MFLVNLLSIIHTDICHIYKINILKIEYSYKYFIDCRKK